MPRHTPRVNGRVVGKNMRKASEIQKRQREQRAKQKQLDKLNRRKGK